MAERQHQASSIGRIPLLFMAKAKWFQYQAQNGHSYWVKWLPKSPINRAAICDRCKRKVARAEPRLCIDNDEGPERKRGKGKHHQYICADCGKDVPNNPNDNQQQGLW